MKRGEVDVEPELNAFIQTRKVVRHMPPDMRRRVLARARVIIASGGEVRPALLPDPPARHAARAGRPWYLTPAAVAASATLAVGAFAGITSLQRRDTGALPAAAPAAVPAQAPRVAAAFHGSAGESPAVVVPPRPIARVRPAHVARPTAQVDPLAAEIELLQKAHGAFTRQDFAAALKLTAEHSQRFPRGSLAEQREALRVRSLSGSGRTEEARRAAAAFAEKFPRSVLLSAVENAGP
jgi:hypothetical protein